MKRKLHFLLFITITLGAWNAYLVNKHIALNKELNHYQQQYQEYRDVAEKYMYLFNLCKQLIK